MSNEGLVDEVKRDVENWFREGGVPQVATMLGQEVLGQRGDPRIGRLSVTNEVSETHGPGIVTRKPIGVSTVTIWLLSGEALVLRVKRSGSEIGWVKSKACSNCGESQVGEFSVCIRCGGQVV